MNLKALDRNRVILGWLWVAYNALGLVAGMVMLVSLGRSGSLRGTPLFGSLLLSGAVLLLALFGLVTGIGLLRREPWSKVLALVLGVLNLFNVPLGTALGAYTLWFVFQRDADPLFRRGRPGPPELPGHTRLPA